MTENPYQSPTATETSGQYPKNAKTYAPCPDCNNNIATKISYTWWGGAVGPAIMKHVKCCECGSNYNGRTGKSNFVPIVIYLVVGAILVIAAVIAFKVFVYKQ